MKRGPVILRRASRRPQSDSQISAGNLLGILAHRSRFTRILHVSYFALRQAGGNRSTRSPPGACAQLSVQEEVVLCFPQVSGSGLVEAEAEAVGRARR